MRASHCYMQKAIRIGVAVERLSQALCLQTKGQQGQRPFASRSCGLGAGHDRVSDDG